MQHDGVGGGGGAVQIEIRAGGVGAERGAPVDLDGAHFVTQFVGQGVGHKAVKIGRQVKSEFQVGQLLIEVIFQNVTAAFGPATGGNCVSQRRRAVERFEGSPHAAEKALDQHLLHLPAQTTV